MNVERTGQVWEFRDEYTVETFIVLRSHSSEKFNEWWVYFMEKDEVTLLFEGTLLSSELGAAPFWRRLA